MPKLIELTVELEIDKVSCPGVWLCQDGRVSLTVYALGTSYQTCLLPPVFPLLFKDVFYFRKRFRQTCALNNMCCMMKDESLYCELVQWCDNCNTGDCVILAQYLGALNDVLFPPTNCSTDGVDLLMRRSKDFPGILSPKIEVATKIRIDEVWNKVPNGALNPSCDCAPEDKIRSKPVCHTAPYHRSKCSTSHRLRSASRSKSRSRSVASKSCCNLAPKDTEVTCDCPKNFDTDQYMTPDEDLHRNRIQSKFIVEKEVETPKRRTEVYLKISPCVCEICKRYHELFHTAAK